MSDDSASDTAFARPPVETISFQNEPQGAYGVVLKDLLSFAREIIHAPHFRRIVGIAVILVLVLITNMIGQVFLNRWQGDIFRAIEQRDLHLIGQSLIVFVGLIALLLSAVVGQTFFHERLRIRLRQWLSHRLIDHWLLPGRAYRLSISSDKAVNPDQRIQEDVRNFTDMTTDLSIGLVQATLLMFSFTGVLWEMSQNISFNIAQHQIHIPGYMVWVALIYAGLGSALAARIGRPLIAMNEQRYTLEANFRFSIVRLSESSESVAFYSGEADETRIIESQFEPVLNIMRAMSFALARLTWVSSGYGWIMNVLPILVALPGYLQGTLDLGGLMMVVGAFGQVQQSLRWFVDNFAKIADWRAAMHRVAVFRDAVDQLDQYEGDAEKIQLVEHPEGHLSFENLKISLADGEVVIADATAHIRPGERVLIVGDSGSGKSTLFRAIGGLWLWGSGVIHMPRRDHCMFLPQRPYMPPGTLAEALTYPKVTADSELERVTSLLKRVNLAELIPQLGKVERWDKLMSLGQQQRFAFARLLFHRPQWVFLDEATSALDDENQARMMSLFTAELSTTTVLSTGHHPGLNAFHTRSLHLVSTRGGTVLRRRPQPQKPQSTWNRLGSIIKRGRF